MTDFSHKTYIAIDLKSFYASVECAERGLDPLTANLVVADPSRTEKTICLAVSPSLKAYGIPGRARLFEVVQKAKELGFSYHVAPPRMKLYEEYSASIYRIYLKYIAPEDIHVYSIDEVFMDVTEYLKIYGQTPEELAMTMIRDVLAQTGITATAGIGTNLYLAKVAMDVEAKHMPADENGVRMAFLDEQTYREKLWCHEPLTDFWRVGHGTAKRLEQIGCFTMGDVARLSVRNEDVLYDAFGVNAELLIDHAWGWENTEMKHIKNYRPDSSSISQGQVLMSPYEYEKGRLIVKEMTDALVMDLVRKHLVTKQIVLHIGYDKESLVFDHHAGGQRTAGALVAKTGRKYTGPVTPDYYGRPVAKPAHGTANIDRYTSSSRRIMDAVMGLFDSIADPDLMIRRINITACGVIDEDDIPEQAPVQLSFFEDFAESEQKRFEEEAADKKEHKAQQAMLQLQDKFGKNAVLKGMNLLEGATGRERNNQIGGHKAQ